MTNTHQINTTSSSDIFQIFLEDEDGQNILAIGDGSFKQSLKIHIHNISKKSINLKPIDSNLAANHYHFAVLFKQGTIDEIAKVTLKENSDWKFDLDNLDKNTNIFYFRSTKTDQVIAQGNKITLTLENISAELKGGSRGTKVEVKYDNLSYQDTPNETLSGNRLQHLNIVNHRGKKQVPLYAGFLGSNTILNDGTPNELILTIQSLPRQKDSFNLITDLSEVNIDNNQNNDTRWQGNLFLFLQEKIPNFNEKIQDFNEKIQEIQEIQKDIVADRLFRTKTKYDLYFIFSKYFLDIICLELIGDYYNTLSDETKGFFKQIPELLKSPPIESNTNSFNAFKEKVNKLNLTPNNKEQIITILINELGVISKHDLEAIAIKIQELFSLNDLSLINNIIKKSKTLQVIQSKLNQTGELKLQGADNIGLDEVTKFMISFDVAKTDNDSKHWALVEKTDADDIFINFEKGQENWVFGGKEKQRETPQWNFLCKKNISLKDNSTEILRLNITNLKTNLLSGYANLYIHYENIPGYWDGYITVPIHKGPLVYRECQVTNQLKVACVGIGTDEPQAKLHIKTNDNLPLALKVEGNTAISGKVNIGSPNSEQSERLKVHGDTAIQGKLAITDTTTLTGKVNIGSLNTEQSELLKVHGDTAIKGNLQVDGKNNIIPIGSIFPYAGTVAPKGWLFCNGQAYKKTQFPELFEIIGTIYGGNNDEFKVPDLGGRFSVGVSQNYSLALTGGEETIRLTPEQMPSHQHNVKVTYSQNKYSLNSAVQQRATNINRNGCDIFHYTLNPSTSNQNATVSENTVGSGSPHENRPPFLALNYIIKF